MPKAQGNKAAKQKKKKSPIHQQPNELILSISKQNLIPESQEPQVQNADISSLQQQVAQHDVDQNLNPQIQPPANDQPVQNLLQQNPPQENPPDQNLNIPPEDGTYHNPNDDQEQSLHSEASNEQPPSNPDDHSNNPSDNEENKDRTLSTEQQLEDEFKDIQNEPDEIIPDIGHLCKGNEKFLSDDIVSSSTMPEKPKKISFTKQMRLDNDEVNAACRSNVNFRIKPGKDLEVKEEFIFKEHGIVQLIGYNFPSSDSLLTISNMKFHFHIHGIASTKINYFEAMQSLTPESGEKFNQFAQNLICDEELKRANSKLSQFPAGTGPGKSRKRIQFGSMGPAPWKQQSSDPKAIVIPDSEETETDQENETSLDNYLIQNPAQVKFFNYRDHDFKKHLFIPQDVDFDGLFHGGFQEQKDRLCVVHAINALCGCAYFQSEDQFLKVYSHKLKISKEDAYDLKEIDGIRMDKLTNLISADGEIYSIIEVPSLACNEEEIQRAINKGKFITDVLDANNYRQAIIGVLVHYGENYFKHAFTLKKTSKWDWAYIDHAENDISYTKKTSKLWNMKQYFSYVLQIKVFVLLQESLTIDECCNLNVSLEHLMTGNKVSLYAKSKFYGTIGNHKRFRSTWRYSATKGHRKESLSNKRRKVEKMSNEPEKYFSPQPTSNKMIDINEDDENESSNGSSSVDSRIKEFAVKTQNCNPATITQSPVVHITLKSISDLYPKKNLQHQAASGKAKHPNYGYLDIEGMEPILVELPSDFYDIFQLKPSREVSASQTRNPSPLPQIQNNSPVSNPLQSPVKIPIHHLQAMQYHPPQRTSPMIKPFKQDVSMILDQPSMSNPQFQIEQRIQPLTQLSTMNVATQNQNVKPSFQKVDQDLFDLLTKAANEIQ